MNIKLFSSSLVFFLLISLMSYGQALPVPEIQRPYIFHKGNRYKVKSNWINFGVGYGEQLKADKILLTAAIDYNFHLKKTLLKLGYSRTGNLSYYTGREIFMNDFHVALGKRLQSTKYNFSFYGGASKIGGYTLTDDRAFYTRYSNFGLLGQIEAVRKITYDVGLGLALFGNYNEDFPFAGGRLILYFSNAYKEKAKPEDY